MPTACLTQVRFITFMFLNSLVTYTVLTHTVIEGGFSGLHPILLWNVSLVKRKAFSWPGTGRRKDSALSLWLEIWKKLYGLVREEVGCRSISKTSSDRRGVTAIIQPSSSVQQYSWEHRTWKVQSRICSSTDAVGFFLFIGIVSFLGSTPSTHFMASFPSPIPTSALLHISCSYLTLKYRKWSSCLSWPNVFTLNLGVLSTSSSVNNIVILLPFELAFLIPSPFLIISLVYPNATWYFYNSIISTLICPLFPVGSFSLFISVNHISQPMAVEKNIYVCYLLKESERDLLSPNGHNELCLVSRSQYLGASSQLQCRWQGP